MFGFSLAAQLFQGSAQRTWNCVTQFTNLLWYKFNHFRHPIMPRSRRRHHSRSRSRSRSHSHDRDREAKRRKVDAVDSPAHKRSVSSEPPSPITNEEVSAIEDTEKNPKQNDGNDEGNTSFDVPKACNVKIDLHQDRESLTNLEESKVCKIDVKEKEQKPCFSAGDEPEKSIRQVEDKLVITPKKTLSPKQLQKKMDSEKKRQQRQMEREERERKKQEEKERLRLEKEQIKKEKEELKAKEREVREEKKRKEREEKEAKRKEKEEREDAKRKEREQEKLKKQQELDEKNREKQKIEEQKQKAAQAFVNFFVAKKAETKLEEDKRSSVFMPFQIKSDMRLAPPRRPFLSDEEKITLTELLSKGNENSLYLSELRGGKEVRRCPKTWPFEEDVMIVEEDFGESICDDKQKLKTMRVKFLKFHENKRPPYHGTWRKKSTVINGKRPFVEDRSFFEYEVDSDDDWEEEEQGESLNGSDDEEKENEVENDDYEVDNEFFVPHGHLSDDEVDDEVSSKLSPESHKQKLKLLKDEFDQDMQAKIYKIKPRSIGCIWYNKERSNVDDAIDRHLKPLAMITNGQIIIKKRRDSVTCAPARRYINELKQELIPAFLKLINGNGCKKITVVNDFIQYMQSNGYDVDVSKAYLGKCLKQFAHWKKCTDEGPMFNKYCWCVDDDLKKKYNF